MSTYLKGRRGQLLTGYRLYKSLINPIKLNGIFPICRCVYNTVRMHHMDPNKTHRVKARWKLHKNVTSYLEATPHETTTYFPSQKPSKTNKHVAHCWKSKGVLIWTPIRGRASICRSARIFLRKLFVDTGYSLEVLPKAMDDRDG